VLKHWKLRARLWYEFKCDCCVDGNVPANAKTDERCQDEERVVVIRTAKSESKDGGEQNCKIKCPLTASDEVSTVNEKRSKVTKSVSVIMTTVPVTPSEAMQMGH